ncbi:DUF1109 domain-containing protein [Roseateles sp. SL47]|uniref:DUF1109 domain-containing protein n=1 Tax=Roseateles sp. SL47 TaxID=2995138 RepID=UPI002270A885|nr:DUF1109 domain-containing protein [Roseateles sp. SL47]WAC72579.1 DUF1109 domain-containing protein [Roseateles sp. SL47]
MKTQDLILHLVRDSRPVDRHAVSRQLNQALIVGLSGGALLLVVLFGFSSEMPDLLLTADFWLRLLFPLVVIVSAMQLLDRLARPGAAWRQAWLVTLLPIVAMVLGATAFLLATPPQLRLTLFPTEARWTSIVADIVLLSLPSLAATLHAMRQLAPTRLSLAGAGGGLLAGAQGALIYMLYGPDMPLPSWGLLHGGAIFMTTALGAALGPRYLRW